MKTGGTATASNDHVARVKALLQNERESMATDEIQSRLQLSAEVVLEAVQSLLNEGQAKLQHLNGAIHIALLTHSEQQEHAKLKDLNTEETLVYQIIQKSGNKGIWIKDLRMQSNLTATRLPKALKTLESRNLVKTVKSTASASKKIYMLFELQPSEELTGGTWFTGGTLDEDFIDSMRDLCHKVIIQKGEMTLQGLTKFVADAGFTSPPLQASHVYEILQTLVFDGLIDEQIVEDGESVFVNLVMKQPTASPLSDVPCGMCPVIHECAEGNDVSPENCKYMDAWLDF